ncbi:MAG: serine hydrolase [Flavobacteriales bacterium]|nr:serine hydrolase [Flavobacteriales bacterium]
MKKSRILLVLIAGLLGSIALMYILWPAKVPAEKTEPEKLQAAFLDVDPHWADSVLATLSPDQQLAQLFFPIIPLDLIPADSFNLKSDMEPGGVFFKGHHTENQIRITDKIIRQQKVPLLLANLDPFSNLLAGTREFADEDLFASKDSNWVNEIRDSIISFNKKLGCDLILLPDPGKTDYTISGKRLNNWQKIISEDHVLCSAGRLRYLPENSDDSLLLRDTLLQPFRMLADSGLSVMELDSALIKSRKTSDKIDQFCREELEFKGLLMARFPEESNAEEDWIKSYFNHGVEIFITGKNHFSVIEKTRGLVKQGIIPSAEIKNRARKVLMAKSWIRKYHYRDSSFFSNKPQLNFPKASWMNELMKRKKIVLLHQKDEVLPLVFEEKSFPAFFIAGKKTERMIQRISSYGKIKVKYEKDLSGLDQWLATESKNTKKMVVLAMDDSLLIQQLKNKKNLFSDKHLLIVHFGDQKQLSALSAARNLIHMNELNASAEMAMADALSGTDDVCGQLCYQIPGYKSGQGIILNHERLRYANPEESGVNYWRFAEVDGIMEEAIRNKALPGGQVLFAYKGKIIYHKSYGYHTYEKKQVVRNSDLYDMASVTKVAATTMMAMHFYEKKKYHLDDSLYRYLPDTLQKYLPGKSTLSHITFRQILIHASGLPAGHNIIRFLRFDEDTSPYDLYFCDEKSKQFDLAVADSFYIDHDCLDTLWIDLNKIWVEPSKPYRYSDANMNLMYSMLLPYCKKQSWEKYIDSVFYSPLGMKRTCFNPLNKGIPKEEIAPTEKDRFWRRQLVHGHVHDPTAALYGGVAGNAGLFSNAYDMAVLFEMILQNGRYSGKKILDKKTVELFTSRQSGSHRGLGFNMQIKGNTYGCSPYASEKTYGHTGFTGTAVWVDPEIDLIYVFISNRVHPDPENKTIIRLGTTKRVHNVMYKALGLATEEAVEI